MTANLKKKNVQTRLQTINMGEATASSPQANNANANANANGNAANNEETPNADMNALFMEMTKMGGIMTGVAADVSFIKSDMAELKNTLSATQARMAEAEGRISDIEDKVTAMAHDNSKYAKILKQLCARVDDQENRSRRKNVRLIGLKEGSETGGSLSDYVQKILADGLGLSGAEFEIERCHRNLRPRPEPDQPPRIIMIRFLRYTARHKVLTVAKQKKGFTWNDCRLSIYEDMTAERAAQRKPFSPVMKTLWQHQVKHTLAHPATLKFTWKGQRKSFDDVEEAQRFVRDYIQSELA